MTQLYQRCLPRIDCKEIRIEKDREARVNLKGRMIIITHDMKSKHGPNNISRAIAIEFRVAICR